MICMTLCYSIKTSLTGLWISIKYMYISASCRSVGHCVTVSLAKASVETFKPGDAHASLLECLHQNKLLRYWKRHNAML